ncbi:PREDICTED: 3-hydroxyisobutyryl-CoA hydrolase 1-like isoform X2 [Nelumbo nucifera]|uniref:3-hydroxyisobutyryl-CoA hydrolase n=1 Tax=Nelumbo nucifera TaxID=4432 RepID=A0A1U8Q9L6_NELNU|nr:PREDICTED: 3-hydroxyisobutyryl-CoA hydrolase 1-like isoform X2 [Nelumbo nucifera]
MADNSISGKTDQILVEEHSYVRTLILNRPRQLNALSLQMVSHLLELFTIYEEDRNVKLLILKGEGRAFCAGGDVAAVVKDTTDGHWRLGARFFWIEYTLNYIMATYNKPQVSILNGIIFGGGAGASIHGRFRIATENSGNILVLQVQGWMVQRCLLVAWQHTLSLPCEQKLSLLEEALFKVNTSDPAVVSTIIDKISEHPPLKAKCAYHRLDAINRCFSKRTVEEILSALEKEAANGADNWLSETIQSLKKASPTSLKISLRSIREGRLQSVGQCLVREYRMCCHVLRKDVSKDFFEGCRAILLDKDRNPKWEPLRLDLVSDDMVNLYFTKVEDEEWEDLKLPARPSLLAASSMAKL